MEDTAGYQIIAPMLVQIDELIKVFVNTEVVQVINLAWPIIGLALTLSLMIQGLNGIWDSSKEPLTDLGLKAIRYVMVLGFASLGGLYQTNFLDLALNVPDQIATTLTSGVSGGSSGGSVGQVIDASLNNGLQQAMEAWKDAGATAIGYYFIALVILLVSVIFGALGAGILIMAKISLGIALVFGPAFILLLLFDTTKQMFSGWISSVLTFCITIILVGVAYAFMARFFSGVIKDMADGTHSQLQGILSSAIVSVATAFLIIGIPKLAASWVGGVAAGFGATGQLSKGAGRAAGAAVDKAAGYTGKGASKAGQAMGEGMKKGLSMAMSVMSGGASKALEKGAGLARKGN